MANHVFLIGLNAYCIIHGLLLVHHKFCILILGDAVSCDNFYRLSLDCLANYFYSLHLCDGHQYFLSRHKVHRLSLAARLNTSSLAQTYELVRRVAHHLSLHTICACNLCCSTSDAGTHYSPQCVCRIACVLILRHNTRSIFLELAWCSLCCFA